jgi:hypothetical protein
MIEDRIVANDAPRPGIRNRYAIGFVLFSMA